MISNKQPYKNGVPVRTKIFVIYPELFTTTRQRSMRLKNRSGDFEGASCSRCRCNEGRHATSEKFPSTIVCSIARHSISSKIDASPVAVPGSCKGNATAWGDKRTAQRFILDLFSPCFLHLDSASCAETQPWRLALASFVRAVSSLSYYR